MELITFFKTTAGLVTSITIIIGAIISLIAWGKKSLRKVFREQLTVVNNNSKKVSKDTTEIRLISEEQGSKIDELLKNQNQLINTDKHILRSLITGKYYEALAKGYLPIYECQCLSLLYEDYKYLHGNSFIDALYEKMKELPTEAPCPPIDTP